MQRQRRERRPPHDPVGGGIAVPGHRFRRRLLRSVLLSRHLTARAWQPSTTPIISVRGLRDPVRAAGGARQSRPRRPARRGARRGRRLRHRQVGAAAHDRRAQPAARRHDRRVRPGYGRPRARRRGGALQARWGVLFQGGALFSSLTVAQNIQVPMKEHTDLPRDAAWHELTALKIELVGLPPEAGAQVPVGAFGRHDASGPGWRARWRSIRRSCSWTSRPPASIRSAPPPSTS